MGYSIDPNTGVISGICVTAGVYNTQILATNSEGQVAATITWTINPPNLTGSVTLSSRAPQPGDNITCQPAASGTAHIAWTENKIFWPVDPANPTAPRNVTDLLNWSPGTTIPFTVPSRVGLYTYILRVVDDYYNYQDFPTTFQVSPQRDTLPFSTSFEDYLALNLSTQHGWLVWEGGANVTIEAALAYDGTKAVQMVGGFPRANLSKYFTDNSGTMFLDVYVKPAADANVVNSSVIDYNASRIGFVALGGGQAAIQVLNGDGAGGGTWTDSGFRFPITSANLSTSWIRLTVRHDYVGHKWDFYANGRRLVQGLNMTSNLLTSFSDMLWLGNSNSSEYFDMFSAVVTTPLPFPSVPTGLAATTPDSVNFSFTLSWTASTDQYGVSLYEVQRAVGTGSSVSLGTTAGTSWAMTGLSPSTKYTMQVRAMNVSGNWSAWSAPLVVTTPADTTAPTSPTSLTSTAIAPGNVVLVWGKSTDNVGVTGYTIYRGGLSIGNVAGGILTFKDTNGLSPLALSYTYTVKAGDAANNLSVAASLTVSLPPPSVPSGFVVSGTTPSSISLSWTAASGYGGVAGYAIYRGGALLTTTVTTSYTDPGLTLGTLYTYTVKSFDTLNQYSGASSPITASPTAPPGSDYDADGIPYAAEILLGTNPNSAAQTDSGNSEQLNTHAPAN